MLLSYSCPFPYQYLYQCLNLRSILISILQNTKSRQMSQYRRVLVCSRDSVTRNAKMPKNDQKIKQRVEDLGLPDFGANKVNIVGSRIYHQGMVNSLIFKNKEINQGHKQDLNGYSYGGFTKNNGSSQVKREIRVMKSHKTQENTCTLPEAVRPQSSKGRRPKTSRNLQEIKLQNMRNSFHGKISQQPQSSRTTKRSKLINTADNFRANRHKSQKIQTKSAVDAQFLNLFAK